MSLMQRCFLLASWASWLLRMMGDVGQATRLVHRGQLRNKHISMGYWSRHLEVYTLRIFNLEFVHYWIEVPLLFNNKKKAFPPLSLLSTLKTLFKKSFSLKVILNRTLSVNSNECVFSKTDFGEANWKRRACTKDICHINLCLIY